MTDSQEQGVNAAILRLRGIRNLLNPAEQRVLDQVVSRPDAVVHGTVSKVATSSRVSDATVVRFCRRAGYESFNDLKIHLAQPTTVPAQRIQRDLAMDDTPAVILEKVFNANIASLVDSLQTIDRASFERGGRSDLLGLPGRVHGGRHVRNGRSGCGPEIPGHRRPRGFLHGHRIAGPLCGDLFPLATSWSVCRKAVPQARWFPRCAPRRPGAPP